MSSADILKAEVSRLVSKEKPLVCPQDGNPCHRSRVNCIDYYFYSVLARVCVLGLGYLELIKSSHELLNT